MLMQTYCGFRSGFLLTPTAAAEAGAATPDLTEMEQNILSGKKVTLANGTTVSRSRNQIFFRAFEKIMGPADIVITLQSNKPVSVYVQSWEATGSLKITEDYPFKDFILSNANAQTIFEKPSIARTSQTSPSFSDTLRNRRKMFERKEFLEKYPDKRITIDRRELNLNTPFQFYCHPDCSIARNTAIMGSDIDCGVVITQTQIDEGSQLSFVKSLRTQGFTAFHETETNLPGFSELEVIKFITHSNLRKLSIIDTSRL